MDRSDIILTIVAAVIMAAVCVAFVTKVGELKSRIPIEYEEVEKFEHCYTEETPGVGQMHTFAKWLEDNNESEEAKQVYSDIKETETRYKYVCLQETLEQLNKERS